MKMTKKQLSDFIYESNDWDVNLASREYANLLARDIIDWEKKNNKGKKK
jgi:hypothetical protein